MKHFTHILRYAVIGLSLCGSLWSVSAQEAESSRPKQRGERDPFSIYRPPPRKKAAVKAVPVQVTPPAIQERINRYKAQKAQAMSAQQPAPKPTTALLLGEMQVIGIFRTPRGYAAMVEATPIKLSYVIYPGETFFDGQLVAIEEDKLVFRHETRWSDGRREMNVETKPLRQPNAVSDSLTADKSSSNGGGSNVPSSTSNTVGEVKPSTPDKQ
ncbi:MAG TPA: hypothetical protein VF658_07095 [Pyrinomonadaceae bacterium]|jgi:hypothetical protein